MSLRGIARMLRMKYRKKKDPASFLEPRKDTKQQVFLRWAILLILLVSLILFLPRGSSFQFSDLKEGSISPRRIVAPFDFEILKSDPEYQRDRELAAQKVFPIFIRKENFTQLSNRIIKSFFEDLETGRSQYVSQVINRFALRDSMKVRHPIAAYKNIHWDYLLNPRGQMGLEAFREFKNKIETLSRDGLKIGIFNVTKEMVRVPDERIILLSENEETIHDLNQFYDMGEFRNKCIESLTREYGNESIMLTLGKELLFYAVRANMIYQDSLHQQRIQDAQRRVPLSSGFVQEKEKIVDENDKITPEIRKKLTSLAMKMEEKGMEEGGFQRLYPFLGKLVFVLALFILMAIYISIDYKQLFYNTKSVFLLALIFFMISLFTYLFRENGISEYLTPVAFGAMLLANIFDEKMGYIGTLSLSILIGGIWGNEFNIMMVSAFSGVMGVLIITHIRNRSQQLRASITMAGVYVLIITGMGFLQYLSVHDLLVRWSYGAINGFLSPLLSYVTLALIEKAFDISTDHRLLELSNLNNPLLRRLSVEATGTYNHSIMVGNLADAAAQAVNANALLARVGSLYHDVGKLEKAEYFVENQRGSENPHKKLTARMSALILSNHVKKGLEIADREKLPSAIKEIMVQHHGKSLMRFFYQKALSKQTSEGVNENDYRYPGPLPQSKEAAIVMLADMVEAATRTLKEPTHSRIKGLIEELVDERFQSGELDQSPLTLRDLERIKEAFLTILAGVFHARVEYPDQDEMKSKPKTDTEKAPGHSENDENKFGKNQKEK